MTVPAAIEFENVFKEYHSLLRRNSVKALNGFSLRVEQGEIFGFLGPNGAGKTTAIHVALGLMFPSSGSGRLLGRPFGDAPTRRRVGFLAENVALYRRNAMSLTRFYGALNGVREPDLGQRATALLRELDLTSAGSRNSSKFSRGMMQRLGLAQALINDPELLILDEPTSALDPLGRIAVREILLRAREKGKTVFLSSHMLSEIEQICDRIAIVIRGKVARVGTLAELLELQDSFLITARGIDAAVFAGSQENEQVRITVPAAEQRRTIEKIWLAGGEVVAVAPVRRTLEELFVEMASGEKQIYHGGTETRRRE